MKRLLYLLFLPPLLEGGIYVMQQVRYLNKLVVEFAKGLKIEKIMRVVWSDCE